MIETGIGATPTKLPGPLLFERYAYPPNSLGYCGPTDSVAFHEYGMAGVVDAGLRQLAQEFHGAWPYLRLIAESTGVGDPLDRRVVEAYWVGNRLLDRVPIAAMGSSMEDRFRPRVGSHFGQLAETVIAGGVPHHSFHVFGVYPWVGLLRDDRKADRALTVLDRCRIRWGQVVSVSGDSAVVATRRLRWDGRFLTLDAMAEPETARVAITAGIRPGHRVSLHWDWVCDLLTDQQARNLARYTTRHLDIANRQVAVAGALA